MRPATGRARRTGALMAAALTGAAVAVGAGMLVLRLWGFDLVCLGQIFCSTSKASDEAGQIHLSWSGDPSTSLSVNWWLSDLPDQPRAEFRVAGSDAWMHVPAQATPVPANGILHRRGYYLHATAGGLSPATSYEYRVGNGHGAAAAASEVFTTRTAPAGDDATFSFIFFSDTGLIGRPDKLSSGTPAVRDFIAGSNVDFLLGGGDYGYGNADGRFVFPADAGDEWFRQWQPVLTRLPFMTQYGNHESFLREELREWTSRFSHPSGYGADHRAYSFDVGSVHFTAMFAPGDGFLPSDDLLAWLDADLASARDNGATWLVVFQHDSLFGHGLSHPADPRLRDIMMPILERHRVDLHLAAQDQSYERTFPLTGAIEPYRIASDAIDRYDAGLGVIYAKVSPAGKMSERTHDFSLLPAERADAIAVSHDKGHHIARVDVHGRDQLVVTIFMWRPGDHAPSVLERFTIVATGGSGSD